MRSIARSIVRSIECDGGPPPSPPYHPKGGLCGTHCAPGARPWGGVSHPVTAVLGDPRARGALGHGGGLLPDCCSLACL
eukprot:5586109-Pyramimonas_sp.AAC.1